jgi:hypothetical protein
LISRLQAFGKIPGVIVSMMMKRTAHVQVIQALAAPTNAGQGQFSQKGLPAGDTVLPELSLRSFPNAVQQDERRFDHVRRLPPMNVRP